MYLEEIFLLDMENWVHRTCLFLTFQHRIQQSLDRTRDAWNHHKLRTEHNKTPLAIYELSREAAITRGYWTGDPGDDIFVASDPMYGVDGDGPLPSNENAEGNDNDEVIGDEQLTEVRELLDDFDWNHEDGNWGIDVYCQAVVLTLSRLEGQSEGAEEGGE
jgi:hypothetical protein